MNYLRKSDNCFMETTPGSLPLVSIIIPAGRGETVKQHLGSILSQGLPRDKYEVIVVSPAQLDFGEDVRVVRTEQLFYPGKMRNIGAKHALGDFLLFLDDDCEPSAGWIETNVQLLKNEAVGAVSGMVVSRKRTFTNKLYDYSNFDLCQTQRKAERILCSATLGIRKKVFDWIGGFDETLRVVEDNDLCIRLNRTGYKTLYEPDIKVIHDHDRSSFWQVVKYMYWGGYNASLILASRYPGFSFTSRVFIKFKHPLFYLILIGPLSVLNTVSCLKRNFHEHPEIAFFAPFIFITKFSNHVGVLSSLMRTNDDK